MPTAVTPMAITVTVPPIVHQRLTAMAAKAKAPLSQYATTLLCAAYAARVKPPTGDVDLDIAVARVAVMWGEGRNTASIAEAIGLSEATVVKVVGAWRAEMLMQGAA